MKQLMVLMIILFAQALFSGENKRPFPYKIYTPHIVVDKINGGEKGAVQLLWQKNGDSSHYEVEVSNGATTYSNVDDHNFHHVMIYFDKDYYWRVRQTDLDKQTSFSPWRPLKVLRGEGQTYERQLSSQKEELSTESDHYLLDIGG